MKLEAQPDGAIGRAAAVLFFYNQLIQRVEQRLQARQAAAGDSEGVGRAAFCRFPRPAAAHHGHAIVGGHFFHGIGIILQILGPLRPGHQRLVMGIEQPALCLEQLADAFVPHHVRGELFTVSLQRVAQ